MSRKASGLKAWAIQRLSAIYLMIMFICILGYFLFTPPANHAELQAWVSNTFVSLSLSFGLLALLIHAWIGMRDIFIDYVHALSIRILLLTLTATGLIVCGLWGLQIILLVNL